MVIKSFAAARKPAGLNVSIRAPSGLSRDGLSRCYTPASQWGSYGLPNGGGNLAEPGLYTVTISATQDVSGASLYAQVYDEYAWYIQGCPRQDWNFTPPIIHAPSVITGLTTITVDPAHLLGDVASIEVDILGYGQVPIISYTNGGFGTWSFTFDATALGLKSGSYKLRVKQTEGGSADVGDYAFSDPLSVAW
jgi:hypothetical protein